MKHFFTYFSSVALLACVAACMFTSCNSDNPHRVLQPPIEDVVKAKPSALSFYAKDNEGQNITLTIDAGEEWSVGSNNSWITARKISDKHVEITVQPNTSKDKREGSVFIVAANYSGSLDVSIAQEGREYTGEIYIHDLAGEYSVEGDILVGGLTEESNTNWDVVFNAKTDSYGDYIFADNWAGLGIYGCYFELNKTSDKIKFDSKSSVASSTDGTVIAYIMFACIFNNTSLVIFEPDNNEYEIGDWDEDAQTLTFEPGFYDKDGELCEVFVFCAGFLTSTGDYARAYSDGYRKIVFTKKTNTSGVTANVTEQPIPDRNKKMITKEMLENIVIEKFDPARHVIR